MASDRQLYDLGAEFGFEPAPRLGFVGMMRTRTDGRVQRLDIFTWSNAKWAQLQGNPHAYLVICPGSDAGEDGRWRLPLTLWPEDPGTRRPWAQSRAEFRSVIAPILDGPIEQIPARMDALGKRYELR